MQIVDSAATTAAAVREELEARSLLRREGWGSVRFLATDGAERFAAVGSRFLDRQISPTDVDVIDL